MSERERVTLGPSGGGPRGGAIEAMDAPLSDERFGRLVDELGCLNKQLQDLYSLALKKVNSISGKIPMAGDDEVTQKDQNTGGNFLDEVLSKTLRAQRQVAEVAEVIHRL